MASTDVAASFSCVSRMPVLMWIVARIQQSESEGIGNTVGATFVVDLPEAATGATIKIALAGCSTFHYGVKHWLKR